MEKSILLIHPKDKTTEFLDRTKNYLVQKFGVLIHHFNIYPNSYSHDQCLERIRTHTPEGFIVFFGHGRTDMLFGAKGDLYDNIDFASPEAIAEQPDDYYNNKNFIHQGNIDVFAGKKVFCLACNSNDKIANYALDGGAKVFLGFGDIPTSIAEFKDDGLNNVSNNIVKLMKTELNYIIRRSLELGIINNYSFNQLRNIIHFITNQRIVYYLRGEKTLIVRHTIADYLYELKKNIKILGDNKLPLLH